MTHRWLTVVLALENFFVLLVYVAAFARITWHNRRNTFLFLGGLTTTVTFAVVDLTALMLFLRDGV